MDPQLAVNRTAKFGTLEYRTRCDRLVEEKPSKGGRARQSGTPNIVPLQEEGGESKVREGETRTPAAIAASLIMKGCLAQVLGFPIGRSTVGVHFSKGNKVRITVCIGRDSTPSDQEMTKVIQEANAVVASNLNIDLFAVSRDQAEGFYGDAMFDRFEVPETITELRLISIPTLVLSCSPHPVSSNTGVVGTIELQKVKFRSNKQELEVQFTFTSPEGAEVELASPQTPGSFTPPSSDEIDLLNGAGAGDSSENAVSGEGEVKTDDSQKITPWEVETDGGEIDYNRLVNQFGSQLLTDEQLDRIESLTSTPIHPFLSRKLFFSHRDLNPILDDHQNGNDFYLYTGRGPSSQSLHLGHMIPFQFTKYLQDAFNVPLVIQLTDDEKFLFKSKLTLEEAHHLAFENAKDIIACGFDVNKTFIFSDLSYIQHLYPTALKVQKCVTFNQSRGIFGFTESTNIGCVAFPAIQAAPAFDGTFSTQFNIALGATESEERRRKKMRCLIPCAIDQDAYFRMTRDVAPRIGYPKPSLIHSKFFPSLLGSGGKMSSSTPNAEGSTIFMTDSEEEIRQKIMSNAVSGGGETLEEHRMFGANLEKDVSYQYLKFFLRDEELFDRITRDYKSGEMLTTEVKTILIDVLTGMVREHKERRDQVTDADVQEFMRVRSLV
jgi:tryptophanyl-tRNA synthetase